MDPRLRAEQATQAVVRELVAEFGAVPADQIGAPAEAPVRVCADEGRVIYPRFQFDHEDQVLPVVSEVASALASLDLTDTQLACWFVTRTGWLEDRRPVDLLQSAPGEVLMAAQRLREPPFD